MLHSILRKQWRMERGKGLRNESSLEKNHNSFLEWLKKWAVWHRGEVNTAPVIHEKREGRKKCASQARKISDRKPVLALRWRQSVLMQMFARFGNHRWLAQFWKKSVCPLPCSCLQRELRTVTACSKAWASPEFSTSLNFTDLPSDKRTFLSKAFDWFLFVCFYELIYYEFSSKT